MRKLPADRWLQVGAVVFGAGALLVVSWLVYVISAKESFWQWPGVLGAVISAAGAVFLVVGFFRKEDPARRDSGDTPNVDAVIHGDIRKSNVQIGKNNRIRR
jgi:hypothetical protein